MRLMTEALDILDEIGAPGEIGSMLDFAAARMEKWIDRNVEAEGCLQALMPELEREFNADPASSKSDPSPWDIRFDPVSNRNKRS